MANTLQFDIPSMASFSVLLIMAAASLALSVSFFLKCRSMRRMPKGLRTKIFDRTFNVFDPFAHPRKTFHSYLFFVLLSPLTAFTFTFIVVFVVLLEILEAGLIAGLFLFVLCLSLMMIGDAFEIYGNAARLVKAAFDGTAFGKGDIVVLYITKKSLRRLGVYYFALTLLFSASFFAFPYLYSSSLAVFAQFVGAITAAALPTMFFAPVLISVLFGLFTFALFVLARKLRTLLFGFPPSGALTSAGSANARFKLTYENLNEVLDSDPDEITW